MNIFSARVFSRPVSALAAALACTVVLSSLLSAAPAQAASALSGPASILASPTLTALPAALGSVGYSFDPVDGANAYVVSRCAQAPVHPTPCTPAPFKTIAGHDLTPDASGHIVSSDLIVPGSAWLYSLTAQVYSATPRSALAPLSPSGSLVRSSPVSPFLPVASLPAAPDAAPDCRQAGVSLFCTFPPVPGAASYDVGDSHDVWYAQALTPVSASKTAVTLAIPVTSIPASTPASLAVRAVNSAGPSELSIPATVTVLRAPDRIAQVSATSSKATITWAALAAAASYQVVSGTKVLASVAASDAATLTATVPVSRAGTPLSVIASTVPAPTSSSSISPEATITARAAPPAPTGVVCSRAALTVACSWAAVAGASSYKVLLNNAPATPPTSSTSASFTVPPMMPYMVGKVLVRPVAKFNVVATDDLGASDSSATVSLPPLSAPVVLTSSSRSTITLSWSKVVGASSYSITGVPGHDTVSSSSSSYTVSGLSPVTAYHFTVTALASVSDASAPTVVDAATSLNPPTGLSCAATAMDVTCQIPNVEGAKDYQIFAADKLLDTVPALDGQYSTVVLHNVPSGSSRALTARTTCLVPSALPDSPDVLAISPPSSATVVNVLAAPKVTISTTAHKPTDRGVVSASWAAVAGAKFYFVSLDGETAVRQTALKKSWLSVVGELHDVTVVAVAANGDSSVAYRASTRIAPSPPSNVTAVASGAGSATVSFVSPTATGGSPVTSYKVFELPQNKFCTAAPPALSCTVDGLDDALLHTFTVKASHSYGTSVASAATVPLQLIGVPTVPKSLSVVPSDASLDLSWSAPAYDGSASISQYVASLSPSDGSCTVDGLHASCSGLSNGIAYSISVVAVNSFGVSPAATATSIPRTRPSAPTIVAALGGKSSVSVDLAPPSFDGGAPVLSYTLTASPSGLSVSAASGPLVLSGLSNGTSYSLTLTASNVAGTSVASEPLSAMPRSSPASPSSVVGIPSRSQVALSWVAPSANGSPIINYTATAMPGAKTCSSSSTSCTITGLSNGAAYSFSVTATNGVGTSVASDLSAPVTPFAPPAAPAAPSASPNAALISWSAPTSNGSPITSFTVTSSPESLTCSTSSTSCTVSGLTNGTSYSFTVTASNAAGPSKLSDPSPAVIPSIANALTGLGANGVHFTVGVPDEVPPSALLVQPLSDSALVGCSSWHNSSTVAAVIIGVDNLSCSSGSVDWTVLWQDGMPTTVPGATVSNAPKLVLASPSASQASVAWQPPTISGNSPVVSYKVTSNPGAKTCIATSTSCVISGLTNGTAYSFSVVATNATGTSRVSESSTPVTPAAPPASPSSVSAVRGDQSVRVSWKASAANGSPVTSYLVSSTTGSFSCSTVSTSCTVSHLSNGSSYAFTVTATNDVGTSPASAPSPTVTPAAVPSAPSDVVAQLAPSSVVISWSAPAANGAPITSYTVTSSPGAHTCSSVSTSCAMTNLTNGTSYTFVVSASNSVGISTASSPSAPITPAAVPSAPASIRAIPGDSQATILFSPSDGHGSPVIFYTVTASPSSLVCVSIGTSCTISGLTNGTAYTFTASATNEIGTSPESSPSSATTPASSSSVPSAPSAVSLTAQASSVSVSWSASSANGSPVSSYTAIAYASNQPTVCNTLQGVTPSNWPDCTVGSVSYGTHVNTAYTKVVGLPCSTSSLSCEITSLSSGTTYYVEVYASNSVGVGPASTPRVSASPTGALPSAPVGVTAIPYASQALVSWSAAVANGAAVSSYTVTSSPDSLTCTTVSTSCMVSGLTNGTAYTFSVTATNSLGVSNSSSPSVAVTPVSVPSAPSNVSASASNASASVSWTASLANGSPISSYTVSAVPSGLTCSSASSSCTISGLSNGVAYTFTVTALNAVGSSPSSSPSSAVTPSTVPSAPRSVLASRLDASASVSWTAPASNGGSAISSYTVTSSPGALTCSTLSTSCTVSGLTNGTAYTFTVTASNAVGKSASSDASAPATPASAPSAPTAVVGVRANASVSLSWVASSANGSPITSYTAISSPGSYTCSSSSSSCTISGLTNGTAYTFTVSASNAVGSSPLSSPSASVTPGDVPDPPSNVSALASSTSALISWSAPASNGSTITSYTVTSTPGGFTCTTSSTSCTISGLTNGTSYTFTLTASNAFGSSSSSDPSTPTTPATVPDAPAAPTGVVGNASVALSWIAPTSNGSSIISYTVTSFPGSFSCTTSATSCTVTNLSNGTAYSFKVSATNHVGLSALSSASSLLIPAAPPTPPSSLVAVSDNASASLSWSAPSSNGAEITSYTVTSSPGSYFCTVSTTACSITGLTNGTSYTFTVTASNSAGTSASSAASAPITPAAPPSAPTALTAIASNASAALSWVAPQANGAPITSYTVTSSPGGFTCTASSTSCSVTGLSNGVAYTFTVTASNSAGVSDPSLASAPITPAAVPSAPAAPVGVVGNAAVVLSWSAPAANGADITSYTVTSSPGGLTCSTATTSCTVSNLSNGTAYTFTVSASNALGSSAASAASASFIPLGPPATPAAPTGVASNASVSLSWIAPLANGSAISSYTVTSTPGSFTCTTASTSCTVSNLSNGTAYTFTLTATNSAGTSPSSSASAAFTPATVPSTPQAPTGVPGAAQVSLSWSAPASNGADISSYTVTSTPGSFTCTSSSTSCVVSGLTNGVAYTFKVTATNSMGSSSASTSSASLTPVAVPSAPSAPTVTVTSGTTASVLFASPSSNGAAITSYSVRRSTDPTFASSVVSVSGSASPLSLSGLTPGTYYVQVAATNSVGMGAYSSSTTLSFTAPSAVTTISGTAGAARVSLSWTAPSAGASAITGYKVEYSSNSGSTWSVFSANTASTATTVTVTGLTNSTAYVFRVEAISAIGTGPSGTASASLTPVASTPVVVAASYKSVATNSVSFSSTDFPGVAAGDTLIAFVGDTDQGAGGTGLVYVTPPSGWSLVSNTKAADSGVVNGGEVLTHTFAAGEAAVFQSVGTNAGDQSIEVTVVAVRGVSAVDVGKASFVSAASTSWSLPVVSVAGSNRLVLGMTFGSTGMVASGFSASPTILKSNQKGTGAKNYSSVAAWSNPSSGSTSYTASFATASSGYQALVVLS